MALFIDPGFDFGFAEALTASTAGVGVGGFGLWLGRRHPLVLRLRVALGIRSRIRPAIARLAHSRAFDAFRSVPTGLSLDLVLDGVKEVNRVACESAPNGRLVKLDGVEAAVLPATPSSAVLNSVVYLDEGALAAALDELVSIYDGAQVAAWTVRVPARDFKARRLLKRNGHRFAASATAMGRRLEGVERPPPSALEDWTASGDPRAMTDLCDRVFGFGTAISRTYSGLSGDSGRVYVAYVDQTPVSTLLTCVRGENCCVVWVATAPEARRRGLSTALLKHALADAAESGCRTSTLVASPMGKPGYRRLGYHDLGPVEQWEWRDA